MKLRFNGTQGFILALIVHLLVLGLLFFGIDSEHTVTPQAMDAEPQMIEAVVIDQAKINEQARQLKEQEKEKKRAQEKKIKAAAEAEKKRQQEEKRLADLKKQNEALKQQQEKEKQALKEAEQKRLEIEQQQAKQQAEIEVKRKEEEARQLAKEKAEKEAQQAAEEAAEKKRLEEEQQKEAERLAEEKRQREAAEAQAELEREKLAEQEKREQAARQQAADEEAKKQATSYYAKIAQVVANNFNIKGFVPGLQCVLQIKMVPGGKVVNVKVVESSGDVRFDRQAELAAQKASPLPVPDDVKIFNQYFKTIKFRFKPE